MYDKYSKMDVISCKIHDWEPGYKYNKSGNKPKLQISKKGQPVAHCGVSFFCHNKVGHTPNEGEVPSNGRHPGKQETTQL